MEPLRSCAELRTLRVRALVCLGSPVSAWAATITSLRAAGAEVVVLAGAHVDDARHTYAHMDDVAVSDRGVAQALHEALLGELDAVFVVHSPVVVPVRVFERAVEILGEDLRVSTVSFLSNNAGYLSFPDRNLPSGLTIDGHTETTITDRLRATAHLDRPFPLPVPAGAGVLLSVPVMRAIGGIDASCPNVAVAVLDFALRGARRGFRSVLDASTYVFAQAVAGAVDPLLDEATRLWLHLRHPFFPGLFDRARVSEFEPVGEAVSIAAATVRGLRVLIDGSCLGPYEMGTQVQTLRLIEGLCASDGVRQVVVGVHDPHVLPPYTRTALSHAKVRLCQWAGGAFPDCPQVDVVHRPFQPDADIPWERWRQIAHRSVVTIQDLIAFDNGFYHPTQETWMAYRDSLRDGIRHADGVVAISYDAAASLLSARLPVPRERVFTVEVGTGDGGSGGSYVESPPIEILELNLTAADFILVLGASWAHKNRDVAIRTWRELRARGHRIALVLAGVVVPFGSTRNEEALISSHGEWPLTLADVTSGERDWLLRHARVVLYPTSAEGFGLVPFEAAQFGTPTAFVRFGPLLETLANVPESAADWSPEALADSVARLLADPDLARRQVAAVAKAGEAYSWRATAEKMIDAYLRILAEPARL